ncbi:hypothetical protein L0337_31080 [candidate division KSB1 bacterium]|nr:hypothetical protein [candidate division KSB1 bacterium]
MLKRISLANALAVFAAASGTFFFIASTTSSDVHNLAAPIARASAAPLNAAAEPDKVFNDKIKELARNNASIDDAGKDAIDLGEFIIHAR